MQYMKIPVGVYIILGISLIVWLVILWNIFSFNEDTEKLKHIKKSITESMEYLDGIDVLQIPRNITPELEGALRELETLFIPFEDFNLYGYDAFGKDTDDKTLQKISNMTFNKQWAKELYYYELEEHKHKDLYRENIPRKSRAYTLRSNWVDVNGVKGSRLIKNLKGTSRILKKNWVQNSGTLIHRYIKVLSSKYVNEYKNYILDIKGLFYYPPGGFREWHTNMHDDTSWRLYYIHTTESNKSWFRYVPRGTSETVVLSDKTGHFNMFKLRKEKKDLVWHSVYSDTHRFSVGFKISPLYAYIVAKRYEEYVNGKKENEKNQTKKEL